VVVDADGLVVFVHEEESELCGELVGVGNRHHAEILGLRGAKEDAYEPLLWPILRADRRLRHAFMMPKPAVFPVGADLLALAGRLGHPVSVTPGPLDAGPRRVSQLRGSVALILFLVLLVGAACSRSGHGSMPAVVGTLAPEDGPLEVDWAVAATGTFRETHWTLESKAGADRQVCVRLRAGDTVLAKAPCVADIATVLTTGLVQPELRYGYLVGVTDQRIRSIRFTTSDGVVDVPVVRQAFVYWTDHPFGGPKQYDALDGAGRAISANAQCTPDGCP